MVTVRYFAGLREQVGRDFDEVLLADSVVCARDLWRQLHSDSPPSRLMVAINHEHASLDSHVSDGDELAFFPPVTGG